MSGRQLNDASKPVAKASALIEDALDTLIEQLEAGKSEQLLAYLDMMGQFHRYSFKNLMLIVSQRPDASRVAGFTAWKKFGRFVRKGERGIIIIAPIVSRRRDKNKTPPTTKAATPESDDELIRGYRAVHVFDVSQTDGDPLPEMGEYQGEPGNLLEQLKQFTVAENIELELSDSLGSADGRSHGGKIEMKAGMTEAVTFAVLAHELAHERLHHGNEHRPSKRVGELEAEAVAHIVCQACGLEPGFVSSDYIQMYGGDSETLLDSLERIRFTADWVLNGLEAIATADANEPITPAPAGEVNTTLHCRDSRSRS